MSQIDDVAYGLAIFKAYGATVVNADYHEIIVVPVKDVNESDVNTLEAMGWCFAASRGYWYISVG